MSDDRHRSSEELRAMLDTLRAERRLLRILLSWQIGHGDGYQAVAASGMTGDQLLGYLLGELRAGEEITEAYPTPLKRADRPRRDMNKPPTLEQSRLTTERRTPMTPQEIEAMEVAQAALGPMGKAIAKGNVIFLESPDADPGNECWEWLYGFIRVTYALIKQNRLTKLRICFTFDTIERR